MISFEASVEDLFQVFTVVGIASILEDMAEETARFWWDEDSVAHVDCGGLDIDGAAALVRQHASEHGAESWLGERSDAGGSSRATLSPRVGRFKTSESLQQWQASRWNALDKITPEKILDWRLLGALGEPAYWYLGKTPINPDYGASVWEMCTRNGGRNFVQHRLGPLGDVVAGAKRDITSVARGIAGQEIIDEHGKNSPQSRTPTGLRSPGPTDNAAAWCALWGLSTMPTRHIAPTRKTFTPRSHSAGTFWEAKQWWFTVPIPTRAITLSRFRAVTRSAALNDFGRQMQSQLGQPERGMFAAGPTDSINGRWLSNHGIGGVTLAFKFFSDNANSPEPWAVPVSFETTTESGPKHAAH